MNFYEFRLKMFDLGVFTGNQVRSWHPEFDTDNITRWVKKNYLVKLRNGYYTFPEYQNVASFNLYIANRIYKPSYISLHYTLKFYGIIPEEVTTITSVSTLKTCGFQNVFGTFSYQTLAKNLYFGYEEKKLNDRAIFMAFLEKAILDLFYLYEFYNSEKEIELLRFDKTKLEELDKRILFQYLEKYQNISLEKRIKMMMRVYQL